MMDDADSITEIQRESAAQRVSRNPMSCQTPRASSQARNTFKSLCIKGTRKIFCFNAAQILEPVSACALNGNEVNL